MLKLIEQLRRFRCDTNGGMITLFGLSLIPIIFAVGAAVDYGLANKAKAKLDGVADTAALAVVGHQAMSTDITTAQPTAQSIFNALASNIPNVTITVFRPK